MSIVYCRSCGKELHQSAKTCPSCGASQSTAGQKNRNIAALLALFLGSFGVHRFYLGQWWGVFYLLLFWTLIPALAGIMEALAFLFSKQENWDKKYNGGLPSGTGGRLITLVVTFVFIFIVMPGILIAVHVPTRQDYTTRAQVTEGVALAAAYKNALAEYYSKSHDFSGVDISDFQNPVSGRYVDTIRLEMAQGNTIIIAVTYKGSGVADEIAGKNLHLATEDGGKTWECGYAIHNPALRGEGLVQPVFLPGICK